MSADTIERTTEQLEDFVLTGRYEELAKALTAPDSVEQLVRMAKLKPDGVTARYLATQILGLSRAASEAGR
jgi:hypothetical protein